MASDDDWEVEEMDLDETEADEETDLDETDEDDEWRFSLSDLEEGAEDEESGSAIGGNVFGSLNSDTEVLEPGSPTAENTVFVLVGLLLAGLLFYQFFLLLF